MEISLEIVMWILGALKGLTRTETLSRCSTCQLYSKKKYVSVSKKRNENFTSHIVIPNENTSTFSL